MKLCLGILLRGIKSDLRPLLGIMKDCREVESYRKDLKSVVSYLKRNIFNILSFWEKLSVLLTKVEELRH
jgi:hypothetical protein